MLKHHSPAKSGHSTQYIKKERKAQKTAGHVLYQYMYTFTAKDDDCL